MNNTGAAFHASAMQKTDRDSEGKGGMRAKIHREEKHTRTMILSYESHQHS